MYFLVSLFVLGGLGLSMGLPVEDLNSRSFNPEDLYASWRDAKDAPGRIVGGWDASEADAPHMVAILIGVRVSITSLVCGGFLISDNAVVTAGHCIEPLLSWDNPETLVASAHGQVGSNLLSVVHQVIQFSRFLIHPDYDRWAIKYDVGILWLTTNVQTSIHTQPIALSFKRVGAGERLSVTGFGRLNAWGELPDRLQKLTVKSLSHEECLDGVQRAREEMGYAPHVDASVEICTMHPLGEGYGMCNGDSGSALWLEKRDRDNRVRRVAVGAVSWGFPCARDYPDVHARISGFKDFLLSNLRLPVASYED